MSKISKIGFAIFGIIMLAMIPFAKSDEPRTIYLTIYPTPTTSVISAAPRPRATPLAKTCTVFAGKWIGPCETR